MNRAALPDAPPARPTPVATGELGSVLPLGEQEFAQIARLAESEAGIILGSGKQSMVQARLSRRLRSLGIPSFAAYCALLNSPGNDEERRAAVNALTTNVTRFFREPHHFDTLREAVSDLGRKAGGGHRLRIWSAGCASGEEPYSAAMTVAAALPDLARWDARILATDIDTNVIDRARTAVYPADQAAQIPSDLRRRFVAQDEEEMSIVEPAASLVHFRHLNLIGQWPMRGPFDAIFCRNVAIYFDRQVQHDLFRRFAALLTPGGYLFIGHAESLAADRQALAPAGRTTYRKVA
jgi:chemotaxis protein methyltransferase CheR